MAEITNYRQVALDSDMVVRFMNRKTRSISFEHPTSASLARVQKLLNNPFASKDTSLVSLHGSGTFSVFRSFWTYEKEQS
jgi:hypothetical protein